MHRVYLGDHRKSISVRESFLRETTSTENLEQEELCQTDFSLSSLHSTTIKVYAWAISIGYRQKCKSIPIIIVT